MSDIQPLMEQLYAGKSLSRSQAQALFTPLIAGELSEAAISALLVALKIKGETIDEISGAADALLAAAKPFPVSGNGVIDIVGTGGDGHNTINISTTACFVAAAAGAKVAKHGNRGVSSKSGASDLLSALGIKLTMSPETAAHCLSDLGICFLFAPHYHGGVRHAVPVRQALKTRTLFNVLGPLINPARPDYMLLGVYRPELVRPIAGVLQALGVKRAMVVHGAGLDEVALHGETLVAELKDDKIIEYCLTPADFGVDAATIEALEGGTPAENAAITLAVLNGKGTTAQRHAVAINAACALYISGLAEDVRAATALALQTLDSGRGAALVQQLAAGSQRETTTNE
ncbi:anthranilate phosphoribosyltransferase [Shewanella dokdonensis]|uniref:Anthranilate phosphoribosyltransferase n=1 Tax=Shewanella dokdonensis TaxID=712036 RepID=A0ABX8DHQ6_9GAMM|nr:anthranilate phosphoribosyltransferase [Shewanella dokdonensis]MCL1075036.1 anthranilate phosphoribosyltransferase [Shewanella dokdonensis]QVK23457.1 anthranilate phosphoribosyltransferase [Shewanella dokdonensis]